MPPSARRERQPRQACDNCRARKTRCDRATPCSMCIDLAITCRYHDVLDRKGRKSGRGPVISQLRAAMNESPRHDHDQYHHSNLQSQCLSDFTILKIPQGSCVSQAPATSFDVSDPQVAIDGASMLSCTAAGPFHEITEHPRRLSSTTLLAHIHVFLKHLFPIMPVVTAEELLRDGSRPESLSASRYASVTALCAATHIQLKLDGAERMTDMQNHNVTEMMCQYTEGFMLSCAVQARQEYDIIEDAGTDSLLSSFFLFAAYGNLDKHMHAWFYLSQSLAQCIALDLHDESTYLTLEPGDAELKRRIFWILFVTERFAKLVCCKLYLSTDIKT